MLLELKKSRNCLDFWGGIDISHLRDIEQGILNYMLLSNDNFIKVKNELTKNDFTFVIHKIIFKHLCIFEKPFLENNYSNFSSLLRAFAKILEEKYNIKITSILDILSQPPSVYIDRDFEIINAFSMEKEIAIYSNKRVINKGTIETKDGLTWFNFLNGRLISIGTTNISNLPKELHDSFFDTINTLANLDFENGEDEAILFYDDSVTNKEIESFYLKKDISALKWFDDICLWADKYNLDEDVFPRNRYKLQDLSKLDISNKNINELPKEIGKLTSLRVLDMSDNNIKHLPDEIYQLKNLFLLSFTNNSISDISENIVNLKKLLHFFACNNNIASLPKNFFKLKQLNTLCLHGNRFTSLSDDIGYLTQLSSLTISNNEIKMLPLSIVKLQNLSSIYIENTKITNIPIELLKIIKLEELGINDDLFSFISKNIKYLDVDTINLENSHFQDSSKMVKKLNLQTDTKNWVEKQDKKEYGCVLLFKHKKDENDK